MFDKRSGNDVEGRKGFGIVLQLLGVLGLIIDAVSRKSFIDSNMLFLLYVFLGCAFRMLATDLEKIKEIKKQIEGRSDSP